MVSVVGPQNSGKSTLMNFIFGCDFTVSDGRCTKGVYGTVIKAKNFPEFDFVLVIDTEGLQSIEKHDPEYDRKLTLFCLAVSHLIIVNIKDQFTSGLEELLEICIEALDALESNCIPKPIIYYVFN